MSLGKGYLLPPIYKEKPFINPEADEEPVPQLQPREQEYLDTFTHIGKAFSYHSGKAFEWDAERTCHNLEVQNERRQCTSLTSL